MEQLMAYHGEQPLLTAPVSDHAACQKRIAELEARVATLTDALALAAAPRTKADVAVLRAAQAWR
jgi:hypothetical protein